ncbi:MAG: NAD(P)-dependent oxidoreductase [Betaproteobacteria bacterium]
MADLATRYEVIGPSGKPFAEAVAALPSTDARRIRAVVSMGTVPLTAADMDALPGLGLISCLGSGYEGVDLGAARERRIAITHSPGANAASVADLAMGLLLASVRNMLGANAYLQSGEWERSGRRRRGGRGLTGRRMGIFGLGMIGEKIALRAAAFEMEVGYHNRRQRADVPYPWHRSLLELAQWCDVLMIAVRAGATNRHAVDMEVLRALGSEGHVVNIARGSVIDEAALIEALRGDLIAGAGLDVFEHEPSVPEALRLAPNVALTPHIGGDTDEAHAAMAAMVMQNVDAYFAGQPVPTPVP